MTTAPASGSDPQPTPASSDALQPPAVVASRIKGMFAPTYLTLISIIQGVAISMLAGLVEANYPHFDVVAWILVANTMLIYMSAWNEYVQAIASYVWLQNITDALAPFVVATVELFLAHFAVRGAEGLRGFLLCGGLMSFSALMAYIQLELRARSPGADAEISGMHQALTRVRKWRLIQILASGALIELGCVFYPVVGLERIPLVVALALLIIQIFFILGSIPYWNRVLAYARSA